MKKSHAQTHLEVLTTCPYCGSIEDIFGDDLVREEFQRHGELRSQNIDLEYNCSECGKSFIVESIEF